MGAPVVAAHRRPVYAMAQRVAVLALAGLLGCGLGGGTIPLVPVPAEEPGFKMLRPGARARACGAVVWPYGDRAGGDLLQAAVAELVAQHDEADVVRDLRVSWRGVDVLVAQIGCVWARGDVGRTIPTVTLPHLH
ncbi:MAG TPA: hypothetical protein VNO26_04760 [Candidatus Limnocylindria bacterium]|nr:hypothetical protein [Candidatus Limnocylindria bacterium]